MRFQGRTDAVLLLSTEIKDEADLMCGDDKWWGKDGGGNPIKAAAAAATLEFI